jgi:hypothetical protein
MVSMNANLEPVSQSTQFSTGPICYLCYKKWRKGCNLDIIFTIPIPVATSRTLFPDSLRCASSTNLLPIFSTPLSAVFHHSCYPLDTLHFDVDFFYIDKVLLLFFFLSSSCFTYCSISFPTEKKNRLI